MKFTKYLWLLLLFAWPAQAAPNAVYVAQAAAGAANGLDCADAVAVSYFNNAANWSATPTGIQIGPDTTVHLCGTFTGLVNTTMLTTQGNGTSGHPVVIHFESGAVLTSPAWSVNGAINVPNNFIAVDGVTNGTIQNTLDGTAGETTCLGGTCTVQQANTLGVNVSGTNVTVKSLHITHMCMHTFNAADGGFFRGNCEAISVTGDGSLITQNTIDNTATGVAFVNVNTCEASFNTILATSRRFVLAMTGTFNGAGPCKIHDNHIGDSWIWDSADNLYHHNGLHLFTSGASEGMSGVHFHHNLLDGVWSKGNCTPPNCPEDHTTAGVFIDGSNNADGVNNVYVTRNVFAPSQSDPICLGPIVGGVPTCPASTPTNSFTNVGRCSLVAGCTPANNSVVANNTMIGLAGGGCWHDTDASGTTKVFNNLCATNAGGNLGGTIPNGSTTAQYPSANIDSNFYPGVPASNAFTVACASSGSGCNANSWAAWHATPYFLDVHCNPTSTPPGSGANCNPTLASANLGSNFRLGAGSTAIGAANNLTAMCGTIPELCIGAPSTFGVGGASDGAVASLMANWEPGAYPFVAPSSISFSPNPVAFGNQALNTTSAQLTVTVTNSGGTTETLGSTYWTITGANAADFGNALAGTCGNFGVIAPGGSCTVKLTFTPSAGGARTASFNIVGTINASVSLTGNGLAPSVLLSPININFGPQNTGSSSPNHAVTLTNNGQAILHITSILLTGANAAEFSQNSSTCGATLAISASCTLNLVFSPITASAKTANLTFATDAGTSPDQLPLTGTGITPITVTITILPNPVLFGNQVQNVTSPAQTVTVTSTGTGNEVLNTPFFTITGTNSGDFARSGGSCTNGQTLAPTNTCTVLVTCTPSLISAETANLNISGTVSGTVQMTCSGIAAPTTPAPAPVMFVNAEFPYIGAVTLSAPCAMNNKCTYLMSCSGCKPTTMLFIDNSQVSQTFANGAMTFTAKLSAGTHSYFAVNP